MIECLTNRLHRPPVRIENDVPPGCKPGDRSIRTDHPEFREWKWVDPEQLPNLIVPFKRDLYQRLLEVFAEELG